MEKYDLDELLEDIKNFLKSKGVGLLIISIIIVTIIITILITAFSVKSPKKLTKDISSKELIELQIPELPISVETKKSEILRMIKNSYSDNDFKSSFSFKELDHKLEFYKNSQLIKTILLELINEE